MISNSDMVELSMIEYYDRYEQCLYINALHNHDYYKRNLTLECILRWRYGDGNSQCILYKANRHIG